MKKVVMIIIAILVVRIGYQVVNGHTIDPTLSTTINGIAVHCAYPAKDVYICEPVDKEK